MNIRMADPWIAIPTAAFWCGVGAVVSGAVFNKLSHLVEYTLNKKFGEEENSRHIWHDSKLLTVVSMHPTRRTLNVQNAGLAVGVITVASLIFRTLIKAGCARIVALPLLVGSVATPLLLSVVRIVHAASYPDRWVALSEHEVSRRHIRPKEYIKCSVPIYLAWGSAPVWVPSARMKQHRYNQLKEP